MQTKCTATASWYCVHSKPRAETLAAEHLLRQGYECFLPRILRRVALPRAGRSRCVVEPLFPRYLFVQADPNVQSLAAIRSTR
ncbi:MAG: transcription/translation regulatory transformer protein RfaH, partial [Proteobacteria bacterium]|nr:transcription/translation regulatory transformer protein RfaH [Pseudomonadota bacterium]